MRDLVSAATVSHVMGAGGPESCGRELCPAVAPVSGSFLVSYTLLLSLRARGGGGITPDGAGPPDVGGSGLPRLAGVLVVSWIALAIKWISV